MLSNTIHVSQCPCCNNVVDKSLIGNGIPNQLSSYAYLIFVISFTPAGFLNPNLLHPKITKKHTNFTKNTHKLKQLV